MVQIKRQCCVSNGLRNTYETRIPRIGLRVETEAYQKCVDAAVATEELITSNRLSIIWARIKGEVIFDVVFSRENDDLNGCTINASRNDSVHGRLRISLTEAFANSLETLLLC